MHESQHRKTQELSTADLENCLSRIQTSMAVLLGDAPTREALTDAIREIGVLRRPTAAAQSAGLADLGADYRKLLRAAEQWFETDRAKATEIFQFIHEREQDWFLMNQYTGMEMFSDAWDIYQGLRGMMEERWRDCLSVDEPEDDSEFGFNAAPEAAVSPAPPQSLLPNSFAKKNFHPKSESNGSIVSKPARPALLSVVLPSLRRDESGMPMRSIPAIAKDRDVRLESPIRSIGSPPAAATDSAVPLDRPVAAVGSRRPTGAPVPPWLFAVVPPTLNPAAGKSLVG